MRKNISRYFSFWRILFLSVWLAALIIVPPLLVIIGVFPPGTSLVPFLIILTLLFAILFDKPSFRIGLLLGIILSIFWFYKPPFLSHLIDGMNNRMQDTFFQLRGPKVNTGQVVIVDVDNRSLDLVGQWPWPRSLIAKAVQNLQEDGARVIGFDIVFAEPGRYSLKDLALNLQEIGIEFKLKGKTLDETREQIEAQEWQFFIEEGKLKQLVLKAWERRFQEEDPNFFIETDSPEEREEILKNKFIQHEKRVWEADERYLSLRSKKMNVEYQIKPYIPPDNPLLQMARQEPTLYFLDTKWDESAFKSKVEVIIDNDAYLGKSLGKERVVAGGYFILERSAGTRLLFEESFEGDQTTDGMVIQAGVKDAERVFPHLLVAMEQILNHQTLQESIQYQGMFNVVPDKSGAARYYTLIMQAPIFEETLLLKKELKDNPKIDPLDLDNYEVKIVANNLTYPSIALQMLRVGNGYEYAQAIQEPGRQKGLLLRRTQEIDKIKENSKPLLAKTPFKHLLSKERFIPLDFKGDIRINYLGYGGKWKPGNEYGPEYHFPYVSLSDVLYKRFSPGTFKDKYIFIGSTDPTLQDLVGNPFRAAFPGLEVHATMLDNLISEDYLLDLGELSTFYIFISLLVIGVFLSALIAYAQPWLTALFLILALIGMPILSYFSFEEWNLVIDFIYPWISTILIAIVVVVVNFFIEGREKRFLNATFKSYLSPELIDEMVESGTMPTLGGQESYITAYFTDIVGFSTFSEKLGSPKRLVELLNEYLTEMTDLLMKSGGTLDKYEGDAIIAFFGAPMPLKNHAAVAMKCALEMQKKLGELRKKWASEGDKWPVVVHQMRMRIGINSGKIVTGNMGSTQRMNYTMMGDAVNLAARLESGAKQYGVYTMCSEDVLKSSSQKFLVRHIDKLRVVGKLQPVEIYEILEEIEESTPDLEELVKIFSKAKSKYYEMKWEEALSLFKKCLTLEPYHPERAPGSKITPSHVFIERCEHFKHSPPVSPGEKWDGVFTATEK